MSERDPALVKEFSTELAEHIAVSEQILVQADAGAPSMEEINLLFRSFHSVKGLSRVVNHRSLESLAHSRNRFWQPSVPAPSHSPKALRICFCRRWTPSRRRVLSWWKAGNFRRPSNSSRICGWLWGGAGAGAQQAVAESAASAGQHPDADLHGDFDTLVALGELFEELLPDISRTLADPTYLPEEQLTEDASVVGFSLEKVHLPVLGQALEEAVLKKSPLCFARFLRLLDNYRFLIGQPCGLAESHAAVRVWFRKALLEMLEGGRLEEGLNLLAILIPGSPFLTLLPALARSDCGEQNRAEWRSRAADAIRVDLDSDVTRHSEPTALVAGQIREVLLAPFQIPDSSRKFLRRRNWIQSGFRSCHLRLSRDCRFLPRAALVRCTRPCCLSRGRRGLCRGWWSARVRSSRSSSVRALSSIPRSTWRFCFSARAGRRRFARYWLVSEQSEVVVLRKLDGRQASSHFGVKPKAVAAAGGGAQVRVPVELLDSMFGRVSQFFNVSSRFNAMVHDGQALDLLQELFDYSERHAPQLLPKIEWLIRQQYEFASLENQAHQLIGQIHETTLGLRVIPIDTLFTRFPRMIRDTAQKQRKLVRFEARSKGIRVDNAMVELLADPLMHMLRNSVDHGIETPEERVERASRGPPPSFSPRNRVATGSWWKYAMTAVGSTLSVCVRRQSPPDWWARTKATR